MTFFLQCFFLLFLLIIPVIHSQCLKSQQLSLLYFKKSLTFYNYQLDFDYDTDSYSTKVMSWNASIECCSWLGVTCNTNGHVVGLNLSSESISGGIDNSSTLFNLQHLQSLNLAQNRFSYDSTIPPEIGKLTNLRYLNLSNNDFSGEIPIEFSSLTKLLVLDISHVQVTSPYFSSLFQNLTELKELYLDGVDLSTQGTWWSQAISSSLPSLKVLSMIRCGLDGPIDQSLAKLQSLSVIQLDQNGFSGPIPQFFANFSNLRVFTFAYNNISAPLPPFFANFSKLASLILSSSELQGTFPKEIFQIPSLQTIDLSYNDQLRGSLPDFHTNGSLRYMDLSITSFSGLLPESIGNLKMLNTIHFWNCTFSGPLPNSITNLTQLVYVDMSSNKFSGPIDSIPFENLVNLAYLTLQDNLFQGSIPSSLFSLPLLPELQLSFNRFSGELQEFSNVSTYLKSIDLSFNNLEGTIPLSIFNLQKLQFLYLSFNNFTAFPFNAPQQLENLLYVDLSHNNLFTLYNGTSSPDTSFPQIQYLNLASNKLRKIPDFLRYNQSTLASLDLSLNQISGKIPNWIWGDLQLNPNISEFDNGIWFPRSLNLSCNYFVSIEAPSRNITLSSLDLHSNQIQGQIPYSSLQNLRYLDFSRNNFTSSIPPNIGEYLSDTSFLSLSDNNFHGLIPLSLCNASFELLDLSKNNLSGAIPECLTMTGTLRVLNLRRNNLAGTISNFQFPETPLLQTLDLSRNNIQGRFPKSLANCRSLEILNVGNNQINDVFPCSLMGISTLRVLVFRSNKFYGSIACPKLNKSTYGFVVWGMLQIIDLAHNNFSGEIPRTSLRTWQAMMGNEDDELPLVSYLQYSQDEGRGRLAFSFEDAITVTSKGSEMDLAKILVVFTLIDLSSNNFSGPIPKEIGEFKALYILNLSSNGFTGEIPSSFGNMLQLESLDLSNNILSGQIPGALAKLTFLAFMNLSNNQLVGRIPTGTQFSTFPKESFTVNKGLWGPPLTVDNKAGLSPPPSTLNVSILNSGDGEINWGIISVEIGFTFGFGVAIGSLVLCKRWSKWYYKAMFNMLIKIFPQLNQRIGKK